MKRGKRWLALLLAAMMTVPQVGVYAEELSDGIEIENSFAKEEVVLEEIAVEESKIEASLDGLEWGEDITEIPAGGESREESEIKAGEIEDLFSSDSLLNDNELDIVSETSGKCGDNLTWTLNDGVLTISGTGKMYDWEVFFPDEGEDWTNKPWDSSVNNIEKVVMSDGITSLGDYAFSACRNLSSINIPESVTSIGRNVFFNCGKLKTIILPENVKTIGSNAFGKCVSLTTINIPNSLTDISEGLFYYCSSLTDIAIPDSVISIGNEAFQDCSALKTIEIPGNVTSIGAKAFQGCACLTLINIPSKVVSIGKEAFRYCPLLSEISVSEKNEKYSSFDGVLLDENKTTLLFCPGGKAGDYSIPDTVSTIEKGAFKACKALTGITIGAGVTTIGDYAFQYCYGLKEIFFMGSALSLKGKGMFEGVTAYAYYPSDDSTWTELTRKNYDGTLTWLPYERDTYGNIIFSAAPVITQVYNSAKGGDIRWKALPNCSGYAVYRQRASEGIQKVMVINDPNTTQCFDSGIKDNCYGRVYHYYITALYKDSSGKTVESEPSDKLVLQRLAPMKITDKIQTSGSSVSIKWACTVNENKSYGYEVQYAEKNTDLYDRVGTFKAFPVEGRSNLSAAINDLKTGKKYWIRVRCYVNYTHSVTGALTKTWSQYSNVVSIQLSSVSTATPAYQVTDSLANYRSGIWIYWTPTNAKGYNVYRKTGATGQWKLIKYVAGQSAYRYHDAEVKDKNGVMYYYTVRGVIGSKLSDYDKNGRGILRLIPADFTKTVNSASGTVTLTWNKNTAATGYEVQYSKDEEFEIVIASVNIPSKETVTTEIKGLEKGETYYFHARAYTVQGGDTYYGQWSKLGTVKIEK